MRKHNANVLRKIPYYCNEISETIQRFGEDYKVFMQDSVYKNATALAFYKLES